MNDIHRVSLDVGLVLHPGKAVAMLIDRSVSLPTPKITIDAETIKTGDKFCYLGCTLCNTYGDTCEILWRIGMAKQACIALMNVWKDRAKV